MEKKNNLMQPPAEIGNYMMNGGDTNFRRLFHSSPFILFSAVAGLISIAAACIR